MGLGHYLFGFSGRINRAKQWAIFIVGFVFIFAFWALFGGIVGFGVLTGVFGEKAALQHLFATTAFRNFLIAACAVYLLYLYITLAITTKRLHDRNKSAWWLLLFFLLPALLQIPALATFPAQMAHMHAAIAAMQAHNPPPPPVVEPPLAIIGRGAATIIWLWMFVELYILRGTVGDNRYGSDPLAKPA